MAGSSRHRVQVRLRAEVVRDLLRRDGDTIAAMSRRMGTSRVHVHKMLSGTRRATWRQVVRMATALDVEPTTIADIEVDGVDMPAPNGTTPRDTTGDAVASGQRDELPAGSR